MTGLVDTRVLGQLLLMQSVLASLPDAAVIPFVIQGLSDIPGVVSVEFSNVARGDRNGAHCYSLASGSYFDGELIFFVQDEGAFSPYADHVRNFVFMLELILEERRQRRFIENHKKHLEQQVAERTAELSQERDKAKLYLDIAGVMLMALDRNGRIEMINKKGAQLLGRSENALLGMDWFENFLKADQRSSIRRLFDTLMTGETQPLEQYENSIINAAGQELVLAWNNTLLRNEAGEIVGTLSSAEDITERKFAENALRESKENLAITLHSIGDAVIATDPAGCVTQMNPTAERLTGWALNDAAGRPLSEVFRIVNATSRETVSDPVSLVMECGQVVGLANHTVLLARDGNEYLIADSAAPIRNAVGDIVGVVLVFNDVSEKYRAEEALYERNRVNLSILETTLDSYWCVDQQGNLIDVNQTYCRQSGYSREELLLMQVSQLESEESIAEGEIHFRRVVENNSDQFETRHRRKDGSIWDVEVSATYRAGRLYVFLRDITGRKQAEASLSYSVSLNNAALESTADGILIVNREGKIARWNQRFIDLWKVPEELLHPRFDDPVLSHVTAQMADPEAFLSKVKELYEHPGESSHDTLHLSDGRIIERYSQPQKIGDEIVGRFWAFRDITERMQAEETINHLAFFDQLTDLPNRALLLDRLKQAMANSQRSLLYGALLFIDLDYFKNLNDTLGHDMGDILLKQVAQRLTECVREEDTVARLGGDEFVVMLVSLSESQSEAASLVERIGRKVNVAFNQNFELKGIPYRITPSIGATVFLGQQTGIDTLLKQADLAMYKAKEAGRNILRFFDPEMAMDVLKRAALDADLREALQKKQFVLHYQAQVTDNQVTGAEALLRWQHPERGLVFPGEFISAIEETGLILPVGQWVLESACKQLADWATQAEMSHLTVAVNISARQLNQEDFVDQVLMALDRNGAPPLRLKLELTESLLVNNIEALIGKMTALKAKGVGFSLDDFGTGYSSLAYLKRLPLDQLKIDQSFVRDILTDPNDGAIAKMIVVLAESLGLAVIAEGVETDAQREYLMQHSCNAYQGYFFSRPVPLDEFESFVKRVYAK